jgi:hypothetical protein
VLEDGLTVVKGVVTPLLKEEDIEGFVSSNISEYFVLDARDYEIDYRITSISKSNKDLHLMMSAVHRDSLKKVRDFFTEHKIRLKKLLLMPDLLMNTGCLEPSRSTAILRVDGSEAGITIIRNKNLFLHTSFDYEETEGLPAEKTLENISYYLNFYAKQNFGETIDLLMIQADEETERLLQEELKSIYDGAIKSFSTMLHRESKKKNPLKPEEAWMLGLYPSEKPLLEKELDYSVTRTRYIRERHRKSTFRRIAVLAIITLLLQAGIIGLESYMRSFYSTNAVEMPVNLILDTSAELSAQKARKEELMAMNEILQGIGKNQLDFMGYLSILRESIPREAVIENASFDQKGITVDFRFISADTSTLDAARLILAINDTGAFELLQLDALRMDNSQTTLQLNLKYREMEAPIS